MIVRIGLCASAILNLLLWALFSTDYIALSTLLLFHTVTTLVCGFLAQALLPLRYKSPRLGGILFLSVLCFFLPVFGICGVCLALLPGLLSQPKIAEQSSLRTELPPLPYKPVSIQEHSYSSGGIYDTLKRADSSEQRATAVLATQHMQTRMAVPLLRMALRDQDDDVRLLAYGILDKKENQVNAVINALIAASSDEDDERRDEIKEQLAQQYWEMAYLGLAEGDVRTNMLTKAENLLAEIIDEGRHTGASAYLLQGKVFLAGGNFTEARRAFQGARLLGVGDSILAPYLAEIAFEERDYPQVKKLLLNLEEISDQTLQGVTDYWAGANA
jgi:hypothetical protein